MTPSPNVVITGSGGAALVAACAAADVGARVTVLEWTPVLGGTTAVSGGMLWIPSNPLAKRLGIEDARDDALRYLDRVTRGEVDQDRLTSFVDTGVELVRYLESETPVRLFPIDRPDYHDGWDGARLRGRVLDNHPFETSSYPGLHELVRQGPHFPPLTYEERRRWRSPEHYDAGLIRRRGELGVRTLGAALAAGLVAAARERGVTFATGTRAVRLLERDGRVGGVEAVTTNGDDVRTFGADAVVLASGGFEWDAHMRQAFLRGPVDRAASPPWNHGDGLRMALRVGAAVSNMGEGWWAPMYRIPGEEYDGQPVTRHMIDELSLPGSILVNRRGQRFVNESINYNDVSKAFHVFDPGAYEYVNMPAWLVFDDRFASTYAVATVRPSQPAPWWFHSSESIGELADTIGVDVDGLSATIASFNVHAREGIDPQFGRGIGALDRYYGDPENTPNPCLAPLESSPFHAVEILPGLLGTKGGVVTDLDGRVLDHAGNTIAGLFACSNVAASSMGPGYPGAGGSLGPLMAEALRCGRTAGLPRR